MEDSKELRTEIHGKLSSNTQASLFLSRRRNTGRIRGSQGWRLSWHQVETWKALNDPDVDVIFNSATDGGREKSGRVSRRNAGRKNPMILSAIRLNFIRLMNWS
ncbi:MAG UNVERIFIED_CONTAM: hypothetical protein LVR29_05085 [Microcystis novacekii LVE1205-3]|jgi:hypothetical protein